MSRARGANAYPCPSCGRTIVGRAKHAARQGLPCLPCARIRNGWQHDAGCTAHPEHTGPCSAPLEPAFPEEAGRG